MAGKWWETRSLLTQKLTRIEITFYVGVHYQGLNYVTNNQNQKQVKTKYHTVKIRSWKKATLKGEKGLLMPASLQST